jgi:serine/threonine protein kinase
VDRERLITELASNGLPTDGGRLEVLETLGRGGNGVAFLCSGETIGEVVAKIYIPPDKRDLDDQSLGRFRNEVKLASTIRHPYVIPAIGSGTAHVGAYVLPYYLMPHAASTLRSQIGLPRHADDIQRVARLFMQACLGVSCLHTHGVVHRDLKPENILISREGSAWIADLGIAHIDPNFVSVSLRTIAAERLLNRDYYAPEQRFGDNSDVDVRADIYALGCILYELFAGSPPVRRDSPPVASVSPEFAALDPVIDRMTSYEPSARYQHIDAAIIDITLALGWVTATARGAKQPEPTDIKEMSRLLRSSNGANRSTGIELALALGTEALPELHNLMGHGRREVRNAAASALGHLGDESSVPFLVAGLHGNSIKASTFRPTIDVSAESLSKYSVEVRTAVLHALDEKIRPNQLGTLLLDFDQEEAFAAVHSLHQRELLLLDWSETTLDLLIAIDEPKAWPFVRQEAPNLSGWTLSRLLPQLAIEYQLELARDWMLSNRGDSWDWDRMVVALIQIPASATDLQPILDELSAHLDSYPGQERKGDEHRKLVTQRLRKLHATESATPR